MNANSASTANAAKKRPAFSGSLSRQRVIGNIIFPFLSPFLAATLRNVMGYRIREREGIREAYRQIVREHPSLLICPNHLTMVDSAVIQWALGSNTFYTLNFSKLPWNVPAIEHFGHNLILRLLTYLTKCIPIDRKGSAEHREEVTEKMGWLLRKGDPILIFPEGRRSRSGRIDIEGAAYGPGLLVQKNPGTAVLCVYCRGEGQKVSSTVPKRGEVFSVRLRLIEPVTEQKSLRGQRDLAEQILKALKELEAEHFGES